MLQNCKVIDTTLREGEQAPGITFNLNQKKHIIDRLVRLGINEIELGIASPLMPCLAQLFSYCRANHPHLQLSLWSRCRIEDINYAAILQPDILSLSIPISDLHLQKKIGRDRNWALATMRTAIAAAITMGLKAAVGLEDATRADSRFLHTMALTAEQTGACRVRIADTVGIASPQKIADLIKSLKKSLTNGELAVHTHNDFGMASANAIAALEAGADWADATILGLGERTGCARLEELVGYLNLICNQQQLQIAQLKPLAMYVAGITATSIAANRPILGERIFSCETGLHLQGLQNDPTTYEPYAPEKVGAQRKLLFGAKSGRRALAQKLAQLGHDIGEGVLGNKLQEVRETAQKMQRPLTETELKTVLLGS